MITKVAFDNLARVHKEVIMSLWNNEYPQQLAFPSLADVDGYLNNLANQTHYFVMDETSNIQGWACVFERENEKWFAMILNNSLHKKGIGTLLLNELKQNELELNGWVIDHQQYRKANGEPYPSPLAFYIKNGFSVCPEVRLEIPTLSAVKIKWKKQHG